MGAYEFVTAATGDTAAEAFGYAVSDARNMHGHGGYTGTIAEKNEFVMVAETPMSTDDARQLARTLIDESDPRIIDKWGPAGCISLCGGDYLFFGQAPS